jgi:hypothetical protein
MYIVLEYLVYLALVFVLGAALFSTSATVVACRQADLIRRIAAIGT